MDDGSETRSILVDLHNDWRGAFLGDSLAVLKDLLLRREKEFQRDSTYGKTIPIIQSSGTGKSRLLDEISKQFLTISFVLRRPSQDGYPPGDTEITTFLTDLIYFLSQSDWGTELHARAVTLLMTAFTQCKEKENSIWSSNLTVLLSSERIVQWAITIHSVEGYCENIS